MSKDININESAILETLNAKIDYDGGNYKGSGLANYVVDRSGDTMTGDLTISKANTATFSVRSADFDYTSTTAPASNISIGRYVFRDKAGTYAGAVEGRFTTGNRVETFLSAQRKIGDALKSAQIKVSVTNTGNAMFEFPRCTTKATTASTASNDKVAVIVQNYCNGASWYRVWSDGWIEQGGRFDFKYATQTITFIKAFTTTNYCFVAATDSKEFVFEKNQVTCLSAWGAGYNYGVQSWYACGY